MDVSDMYGIWILPKFRFSKATIWSSFSSRVSVTFKYFVNSYIGVTFITPRPPHPQPLDHNTLDPQQQQNIFISLDGNQTAGKIAGHSLKMETKCQTVTKYLYFK